MDGAEGAEPSSGPGAPAPVGPRLRRALVQTLVSRWLALVIGVVALGVLSRLLTPREFGVYAGLHALAALVEVLCGAGVAARLVRLDAPSPAERPAGERLALLLCFLGGAALLAEPLTLALLGDQWTQAVPTVRVLSIAGIALPVGQMSANLFVALDEVGAYTRIRIVHQAARVALIAGGATQGLLWACAGGVASTFLRAGMIEAALHRRVDYEVADFAPLARDAGVLTLATLAGPALVLLAQPDAAPALTVLAGVSAAGLGWLAASCLMRHRLVREALVLLADLRGGRAAGTP